ncbi:MAG TPA: aminotransferase class I/II-fold pyridoxal phosphate-dependent enzyme [Polyangiaceae bacterium]|nr:aminotransferase class I/II-fold pyridoxal phosphate-dependent enzyme [Polyangiaceae bacterium]
MQYLAPSRARRSGDDLIFALHTEASTRRAAGEPIVNATVGTLLDEEGRLMVMSVIPDVLRELPPEAFAAYSPIAGQPAFVRAVIRDMFGETEAARWAVAVATPGGSGAIRNAIANFVDAQQAVITTSLYWGPYRTMTDELDRSLVTFPMFDDLGRFNVRGLERELRSTLKRHGRALLVLNSPCHNPSGHSLDAGELAAVVQIIDRASDLGPVAVMLDVAYARFASVDLAVTVDALLGLAGKVMLLFAWSASKSFTQYGLRVGAIVAVHPDPEVRSAVESALIFSCRGAWSTCNSAGMAAVTRALEDPLLRARADRERLELRALLDRRALVFTEFAAESGLRHPRFGGGFFTTVLCEGPEAVAARMRKDGLFVVPVDRGLRVALCSVPESDLPRLVSGIAKSL